MENKDLKDFAVFIMVHGRPEKMWTYHTLRKCGYTGKIFLIADSLDETRHRYKEIYGDELVVFDKVLASKKYDMGDNTGDLRSTLFAANESFNIAKDLGLKNFCLMCDDYYYFGLRGEKGATKLQDMDSVFVKMISFLETSKCKTIAFSQGGDHIGGFSGLKLKRKAMNSFICSTDNKFEFIGRMNEDVTTYTHLGSKGDLFFTFTGVQLDQKDHQAEKKGGLSKMYIDNGTYTKSFFSLMYNPSNTKVKMMQTRNSSRIHHAISWKHATPMILDERFKK
jgi:hypothetical protein